MGKKVWMEPPEHKSEEAGKLRWLLTYADLVTLLLAAFVVLFATREPPKPETIEEIVRALREAPPFGGPYFSGYTPVEGGTGILDGSRGLKPIDLKKQVEDTVDAGKPWPPVDKEEPPGSAPGKTDGQFVCPAGATCTTLQSGTVVSFPGDLLFGSGSAALQRGALDSLNALGGALAKSSGMVRFEGHTDSDPISSGAFPSNWELSGARAASVAKHFINNWAFPPQRVMIVGYGEYHPHKCTWKQTPKECNQSVDQKQKNRRVIVTITQEARKAGDIKKADDGSLALPD